MFDDFNLIHFILMMAVLVIGITIHEFSHAFASDRLGDPTPRRDGRISLHPADHLDPFGTVMMVVSSLAHFGIGWGKPVMCDSRYYKHPRRDDAIVAAAGPLSNILQALVYAGLIRALSDGMSETVAYFLLMGVVVNLSLAFFNLIPIKPLDGWWIMTYILPHQQAIHYKNWMEKYGPVVFLALIFLGGGVIQMLIGPPVFSLTNLLIGRM